MRIPRQFSTISLIFVTASSGVAQVALNPSPTRVIGQTSLTVSGFNPNLVEGREFYNPLGVALDLSASPPHIYVADTGNNRVLGWANAASFSNGQVADVVLGQPDLVTTFAQGPNRNNNMRTTGLTTPVGVAVDGSGNVYIADCGNNRVLRFPQPFGPGTTEFPDFVIGQADFTTNTANLNGIGPSTLLFNPFNSPFAAYVKFDTSGNLWVADPGNNRVLRFPSSVLSKGVSGPSADLVLGQTDFVTNTITGYSSASLTLMNAPTGLAFDTEGNLFVSESVSNQLGRVLVFQSPSQNGQAAVRLVGNLTTVPPSLVNASQIGPASGASFTIGDQLAIADTAYNRILIYNPVSQWTSDKNTQVAAQVLGQAGFTTSSANQGLPEASSSTLHFPADAAFSGTELYVADSGNNRVIVMPQNGVSFAPATRVLGQDAMNFSAINLIEGRELQIATALNGVSVADEGMAIDSLTSTPHLYIADTYNNRVLCFKDLRTIRPGSKADYVIGQPDLNHDEVNYPSNSTTQLNQSGLNSPVGVAVDVSGNLYVADSGNARVLRFPAPFASPQNLPDADIVIGQSSFTIKITDPSSSTMASPYGLAFAGDKGLLVSDIANNRVLFFPGSAVDFKTGMAATTVFGQTGFTATSAGTSNDKLSLPHHISTDTSNRLYVADTANGRVSIFDNVVAAASGAQAALTLPNLNAPRGVFVNQSTGEIWVANTNSGQALRYPAFDQLALSGTLSDFSLSELNPLSLVQDSSGALYVADVANRVVIHFAGVAGLNAANFISGRALAPGMIVSLFSLSNVANYFGGQTQSFSTLPLPKTLGDTQVTVNDSPVPLYFCSPGQINFQMPNGAPSSGSVLIEVMRASTGQVVGSSMVSMASSSPGLFTSTGNGIGQVAAINQDGSINGPSHPAPWNSIVAFYGTGPGAVSGAPPDGSPASGLTQTSSTPQVVIGADYVPTANITYSGLAPGLVGVWQVNVKVPNTVAPTTSTAATPVFFLLDSTPTGGPTLGRSTTMWVKSTN